MIIRVTAFMQILRNMCLCYMYLCYIAFVLLVFVLHRIYVTYVDITPCFSIFGLIF